MYFIPLLESLILKYCLYLYSDRVISGTTLGWMNEKYSLIAVIRLIHTALCGPKYIITFLFYIYLLMFER